MDNHNRVRIPFLAKHNDVIFTSLQILARYFTLIHLSLGKATQVSSNWPYEVTSDAGILLLAQNACGERVK